MHNASDLSRSDHPRPTQPTQPSTEPPQTAVQGRTAPTRAQVMAALENVLAELARVTTLVEDAFQ